METKTKTTYDSWGHKGVATYHRQSDWDEKGWAYVVMSDSSSGHGWAGHMHKDRWDNIGDKEN